MDEMIDYNESKMLKGEFLRIAWRGDCSCRLNILLSGELIMEREHLD